MRSIKRLALPVLAAAFFICGASDALAGFVANITIKPTRATGRMLFTTIGANGTQINAGVIPPLLANQTYNLKFTSGQSLSAFKGYTLLSTYGTTFNPFSGGVVVATSNANYSQWTQGAATFYSDVFPSGIGEDVLFTATRNFLGDNLPGHLSGQAADYAITSSFITQYANTYPTYKPILNPFVNGVVNSKLIAFSQATDAGDIEVETYEVIPAPATLSLCTMAFSGFLRRRRR